MSHHLNFYKTNYNFQKDIFEETENVEALKDPKGGSENPDIFWILVRQAKLCTQRLAKERPEMASVLKSLDGLMSQASIRKGFKIKSKTL